MRNLNDVSLKGKRILLRVDLNSPIENGKIIINPRIKAHAGTIRELSDRGAKLIVISHQGRKGEHDFTSLEQHAKILKELAGRHVEFIDHVIGEEVKNAVMKLKDGEIIVLGNVRNLDDETKADGKIVHELTPLVDYFVLDALSIAHREHASVVGFTKTVPSYAGPVLAQELNALKRIDHGEKIIFIIGGSKIHDAYLLLKRWLKLGRVEKVLLAGVPGILSLHAHGHPVGPSYRHLEKLHLIHDEPELKAMMQQYDPLLRHPVDIAVDDHGQRKETGIENITHEIKDIGPKTIALFQDEIKKAKIIIMNGSPGVYEEEQFGEGTKAILQAIAESSAYSIIGGGHTITAIEKFNIPKEKFGYISLSGKAFLECLEGKELPALKALEENETHLFDK